MDWLRDLGKALLLGLAGAAVVLLTVLGIGSIAGGLSGGLEAAKTVLLMTGSMGKSRARFGGRTGGAYVVFR